jgi:hypothetical protein
MSKKTCKRISGDAATSGEEVVQRAAIRKTVKALVEEDPYRSFDEYIDDAADMLSPDKSKKSLAAMRNTVIEAMARKESSINDPSEAQKRLKLVKKQADLTKKIEGIIDDEKKALPKKKGKKLTNDDIEKLQKVLNDMKDGVRELYADQNSLQKTLDEIDNLKHLLSEGKITKRGKKPGVGSEELNEAKGRLAVLRKNMNFKKNIKHLEDQVSGKVPIEVPTRRPYASEYKMSEVEKQYERENFELDKEIAELKRRADAIAKKQVWENLGKIEKTGRVAAIVLKELLNLPRAILLSGDFASGLNRQFAFFRDPRLHKAKWKAFHKGVLGSLKEADAHTVWRELQKAEGFIDAVQHGLEMNSPVDKVMVGEEQYQSWLIEKSPLGKWLGIKFMADLSQRTYRALLNFLVLDAYKLYTKGITDPVQKKQIAAWINANVGRGGFAKQLQNAANGKGRMLMDWLWLTPRYTISGFEALTLDVKGVATGFGGDKATQNRVRRKVLSSWLWYAASGWMMNHIIGVFGGEEEEDPESNSYKTMWVGDDNVNIWGAKYQPIKFIFRIAYSLQAIIRDKNTDTPPMVNQLYDFFMYRSSMPVQFIAATEKEEYWGDRFPRFTDTMLNMTEGEWDDVLEDISIYLKKVAPIPAQTQMDAFSREEYKVATMVAALLTEQFGINYAIDKDKK